MNMFGFKSSRKKKEEIAVAEREAEREAYLREKLEAQAEEKERLKGYLKGFDERELRLALAIVCLEHSARTR